MRLGYNYIGSNGVKVGICVEICALCLILVSSARGYFLGYNYVNGVCFTIAIYIAMVYLFN